MDRMHSIEMMQVAHFKMQDVRKEFDKIRLGERVKKSQFGGNLPDAATKTAYTSKGFIHRLLSRFAR